MSETTLLSGDLTVRQAGTIQARLSAGLSGPATTTLSFADVDRVDLSFLQLVLAARSAATASGGTLRLAAPLPAAVMDAAARAGLTDEFEAMAGGGK